MGCYEAVKANIRGISRKRCGHSSRRHIRRTSTGSAMPNGAQRLFEADLMGILFADDSGNVTGANREFLRLVGYSQQDLKEGRIKLAKLTPGEYVESAGRALRDIRQNGFCTPFEEEFYAKNGRRVPVLIGGARLGTVGRELVAFVLDLTERKRLQEIDQLKSTFIASVTHELRSPLNTVIGFSSLLLNEWAGPLNVEQKENLSAILHAGKHLLALVNDVIDVSKIEAGKMEANPSEFNLADLIHEAVILTGNLARDKGLDLRVDVPEVAMFTDKRRLLQCLLNLLNNAINYTEKGSVEVSARTLPSSDTEAANGEAERSLFGNIVEIAVADTGVGIEADKMSGLFEPFVRLVFSGKKSSIPGSGLGLYLTRRVLREVLNGNITCESVFGSGSVFRIRIPARLERGEQ